MPGLRSLLRPAAPSQLSWKVTQDQRPGVDALHMHHPTHGTISVIHNPGTGMYEVKHNGSYAGLGNNKGIHPDKQSAAGHARQYIGSLQTGVAAQKPMYNRPSPQADAGKFVKNDVGSKQKTPNADQPMSQPSGTGVGGNIDPNKARAFVAGFNRALVGTSKAEEKKPHPWRSSKIPRRGLRSKLNQFMQDKYGNPMAGNPDSAHGKKVAGTQGFTGFPEHGKGPAKKQEPLMKPYASEAQRRWAHTDTGKKALGGTSAVQHWDKESKGKKLPERVGKSVREVFGQFLRKDDKIKPDVAAQQDAGYNPKLERPKQRERVKGFMEEMKADPSKRNISFSVSNSKLAKDGISSFNLPAVETCPGAGKCAKYCYADTGSFLRFYKTTMPPRVQNWLASQGDDFSDRAIQYLDEWKKTGKHPDSGKKFPLKAIRIHDSGDFYSPKYIDHWIKIAKAHPDVMLYAYTKSHHPVLKQKLKELQQLPNVNIVQSLGSKYDHLVNPDEPHAVVFESEDQMKQAGYADAMNSDLTAADKKNTKVGLYIHGSSMGGYAGLEDHLSGNPELRNRILAALQGKKP